MTHQNLSAIDHAIITCDINERIAAWDNCSEKIFGWSASEVVGQSIFPLLLPPAPPSLPVLSLHDIISTGTTGQQQFSLTMMAQHKDGTTFDGHFIIFSIHHSDSIFVLVRNLTKQKRFLKKISTSCEHQNILDDILKIAVQPVSLNRQLDTLLDYLFATPALHLLPTAAVFLTEPGKKHLTLKIAKGFSKKDGPPCAHTPQGLCHFGKRARTQHGVFKVSSCNQSTKNAAPCLQQDHGHYCAPLQKGQEIIGLLCLYTSNKQSFTEQEEQLLLSITNIITSMIERKAMDLQLINLVHDLRRSNNEMREQKKFSESIIQGLSHGLIVTDLEGNIETFNTLAETIMTPFCDGLSGKNIIDIAGPKAATKMLNTSPASSGNTERELTLASTTTDNKIIGYSVVARENAFGKEVGRILSINDISEIKYVRREMEKMNKLATVAEIASAVAHEVRNPLAGIKIMAQSLEGQTLSPEDRHECITRIIRQVDRLNSLLTEFFSYARPAAPQIRTCSLVDIIRDTQPLIANKMAKSNISFSEHHITHLPSIHADPNQVQQVLLNLFLNAIDALDGVKGSGSITTKTGYLDEDKLSEIRREHPGLLPASSYVTLEIADNGPGMAQEIMDNAFEPFFTTKSSGTGLGLSIVYRTLRENNAAITVNSSPENGTSFTIYFSTGG